MMTLIAMMRIKAAMTMTTTMKTNSSNAQRTQCQYSLLKVKNRMMIMMMMMMISKLRRIYNSKRRKAKQIYLIRYKIRNNLKRKSSKILISCIM